VIDLIQSGILPIRPSAGPTDNPPSEAVFRGRLG
jgi:hypothetical protein